MLEEKIYYINGEWIKSNKATIPFNDAGFLYGDGLFETLRFDNKKIFSANKHIKRILSGLKLIKLNHHYNSDILLLLLQKIIKKNSLKNGIIRIMITRGDLSKKRIKPNIYISIKHFYNIPQKPVKVILFNEKKFPIIRFTPAIKSLNYIGNMLAKKECEKQGYFEPIFYNENNIITECAIRNIFFIKDKTLITPSLDLGILSGVMRNTILSIAKKINLNILEDHIKIDEINLMDEAFISSTGIGLLPCYWDNWNSKFETTIELKKELFNRINNG
jgi:branched-subunit amino acid aminotransferase/4-amino-4-deoxychorismate lyase